MKIFTNQIKRRKKDTVVKQWAVGKLTKEQLDFEMSGRRGAQSK